MVDRIDEGVTISDRNVTTFNTIMHSNRAIGIDQAQMLNSVANLFNAVPAMANDAGNADLLKMAGDVARNCLRNALNSRNDNNNNDN